jgi:arylsulfatase A-like enzyme/predicted Zn-dependent protease
MLLLCALATGPATGCERPDADPAAPQGAPSILLITLDTTRADHLGPYGFAGGETPTYDRLAADGTTFDRAYSSCPLTIPSHSTILTGRTPLSHGVHDNGNFLLAEGQVTLAERFKEAGWSTAAFTSAFPTQKRWGFGQGFDVYHDPLDDLPTRLDWSDQRRADAVVDDALATLPDLPGPLFVWVHLFDAHWPYDPPEPFATRFEGRPYDGEIAFADAQVGRLLAWWDAEHPDSIVLLTADHGEGLGDGGEKTHGILLHDGTIRIPLILRAPGIEAGAVVDDPVTHVDIAPTLLDLVGLPLHEGLEGRDLRQGGSEIAYSEALTGQYSFGLAALHAWTGSDGRYTRGAYGRWYPAVGDHVLTAADLDADLAEAEATLETLMAAADVDDAPVAALEPSAMEMLVALGYAGGDITAPSGTIDPQDVIDAIPLTWRARRAIGMRMFARAQHLLARLERRMPDTRGVRQLRAQYALARGNLGAAEEQYSALFLEAPSSMVALRLGTIAMRRGLWREAEQWYSEALALQPASPEAMGGQVRALVEQGLIAEAEELADRYLLIYPDHAELALVRARMLLLDGRLDEALEDTEWALVHMPHNSVAYVTRAKVLWELGRPDDAIDAQKEALRLDSHDAHARLVLATWLLEVGRNAEAVRISSTLVHLMPEAAEVTALHERARAALEEEVGGGAR